LFCFISENWVGRPLADVESVVSLIFNTTTRKGLKVVCQLYNGVYVRAKKVSDVEFELINILRIGSHGKWNYKISPTK
jgi:pSer/pThr/pTyr-binding forkhead associated (FHA) protein